MFVHRDHGKRPARRNCRLTSPSTMLAAMATLKERITGCHRNNHPAIGAGVNLIGYTRAFAAQQQGVIRLELILYIRCGGLGGQQNDPSRPFIFQKTIPTAIPCQGNMVIIIQCRCTDLLFIPDKPEWFDQIERCSEPGAQSRINAPVFWGMSG